MPLDNRDNLRQAIRARAHNNSLTDSLIDEFILEAEAQFYDNEFQPLRIRTMQKRSTAVTNGKFLELPPRYLQMRRLTVETGGGQLDVFYRAPDQLMLISTPGTPRFFTTTSQLEFDRVPDAAHNIEMLYYEQPEALSDTVATNVVLDTHPSIYLNGTLAAFFLWMKMEDRATYYHDRMMANIKGANLGSKRGDYGSAPAMRLERRVP